MQSEQKELIRKYWSKLIKLSEVQSFAKTLIARNIFTQRDVSNIFSSYDERINRERFFTEIQDKDETYDLLVEWLNTTSDNRLALKLAAKRSGITPFTQPEENEVESEGEDEITSSIEAEIPITFDESRTPLKVQVNLANEFRDSKLYNPHMPFYSCRSKKRGRVLIINNFNFHGTDHKTRTGAEIDEVNVKQLFEQMGGWVIKSYTNKTADEMRTILKSFTKEKREKRCDACFVFIMSHGSEKLNETIIYGSDGRYLTTNQIQIYFTNEKCALFRGKPKVFIYQVCRGHELDLPRIYTDFDGKRHESSDQQQTTYKSTPGYFRPVEDMLIGYATMQGSKAHRDPYRGTWYIELICKHFMDLARYESVDNLLVKVDEGLRKRMSEYGTVQTAEHISKGFKKLYLNPGIYEADGKLERFNTNNIL